MDCQGVAERLPWLLNGTLPASEAGDVRSHLEGCDRCRAEWEETRRAAAVFDAHVPTSLILDLAWDRPVTGLDPGLARSHVESCPECREELELVRASRRLEAQDAPLPAARSGWRPSLGFALPATLAAGLVVGFGVGARRSAGPPTDDGRVARLEAETERLRGLVASLETAVRTARPRVNLPLFELVPALVRRGGAGDTAEIAIPRGATEVALLLSSDAPAGTAAALVVTDAAGGEVWKADGLLAGPPGGYVVTVPVAMLPDGTYRLRLRPARGPGTEYGARVTRR